MSAPDPKNTTEQKRHALFATVRFLAHATVAACVATAAACSPVQDTPPPPTPPTTPVIQVSSAGPSATVLAPEPVVMGPRGKLGETVTVARTQRTPQIDARALIWRARPDETLAMAVRFGPPVIPPKDERAFGDADGHLAKLTVELRSPTGKRLTRSATFAATRPTAVTFWPGRTLFIEIARTGVRVKWPNEASAPWTEGPLGPDGQRETGVWHVVATSEVVLPNEKQRFSLTSGLVPFDVQAHHPRRADLMRAAEPERVKAGASNRHEPGVEGGFVYDTLLQLSDDRWVARFAKPAIWAFTLTSVYLAPSTEVLDVETLDVSTCVAEGMRVDTPDGPRPIEALRVGDAVWGWSLSENRRVATQVVATVGFPGRQTVWHRGLQMSPSHPVWFDGAWRVAGELPEISPGERATVYALTVGEPHTFIAEGVLVHNKDRAYSDKLDDPWVFMWSPEKEWWK